MVKNPPGHAAEVKRLEFGPWVGKIAWRRAWQSTPVFLPGESHGQRSLRATVHGVTKSQTQLKQLSIYACMQPYVHRSTIHNGQDMEAT